MEKVNLLSALWRVVSGEEPNNTEVLDLNEITGENPKLVKVLKEARNEAEESAKNRFKDELYKQAAKAKHKSTKHSKSIPKSPNKTNAITKENNSQMTIGNE